METIGTDGFLRKPFGADEVLRRVDQFLLLDSRGPARADAATRHEVLERGRFRVDTAARKVWVAGRLVGKKIGSSRFALLCVLLRQPGAVRREGLRAAVWGSGEDLKTVDRTVARLRKDLGLKKDEGIVSVPGGYHLAG